jgi:hypothetical protein
MKTLLFARYPPTGTWRARFSSCKAQYRQILKQLLRRCRRACLSGACVRVRQPAAFEHRSGLSLAIISAARPTTTTDKNCCLPSFRERVQYPRKNRPAIFHARGTIGPSRSLNTAITHFAPHTYRPYLGGERQRRPKFHSHDSVARRAHRPTDPNGTYS